MAAAAASKGVVWNHGGATAGLARPAYPGVVNVASPAYRYLAAVIETLAAEGLGEGSELVMVYVDMGFGREVAEGAAMAARRLGLLWRSISFRPGRAKYVLAQVPAGDVLLSADVSAQPGNAAGAGLRYCSGQLVYRRRRPRPVVCYPSGRI